MPVQAFADAFSHLANLQRWRRCLESEARSSLLWHCLAREYWYENLPGTYLSAQLTALDGGMDGTESRTPSLARSYFECHCGSSTCTQLGNLIDAVDPLAEVVHYVKESSFTRHVLRKCVIDDSYGNADDEARADLDHLVSELRKGNVSSAFLASKGAVLSSWGGYFWVTRSDEVDSRIDGTSGAERAERIREIVGLASFFEAEDDQARLLLEVRIPIRMLPDLKVPTTFDANGQPYFRPAYRDDKWGETIDLGNLCNGVPEAIHKQIVWKEEIGNPEPVGELPTAPHILADAECAWLLQCSESMLREQWNAKVFQRQEAAGL